MPEQLGFSFPSPKPLPPAKKMDSVEHLKDLVSKKEPLIFLYGMNPHLCFVRTHSSDDAGFSYPINRNYACLILADHGYYHHSNHISSRLADQSGNLERAKLYRFCSDLLKRIEAVRF